LKKQCKSVVYILCCIAIFYLNAAESQGWWNWVTSLASRAHAYVVQEYLPSGSALASSILGSGVPGALVPVVWAYGWGRQQTSDLQKLAATARVLQSSPVLPQEKKDDVIGQVSKLVESQQKPKEKEFPKIPYDGAVAEFQGRRNSWEDVHVIKFKDPYLIAAVYDGHGGNAVSKMLAEGNLNNWGLKSLHDVILDKITNQSEVNIPQVLKESFLEFDQVMHKRRPSLSTGSAAVVALIDIKKQHIYFAWVGDSRGLLIDQHGAVVAHTTDHKPTNAKEFARIKRAGAYVDTKKDRVYNYLNDRTRKLDLNTGLNMSRAFGDFQYAKYRKNNTSDVISAEPDVISFDLKGKPYKMLLVCDGIFEKSMSNKDVANIVMLGETIDLRLPVQKIKKYSHIAGNSKLMKIIVKNIVVSAYDTGSHDNMTALIIDVKKK
jgi:serine/threonine protein phosphatase PrpC